MTAIESKKISQIWSQHILSRWLPLLLGLAMGMLLAYLISNEAVYSAVLLMFVAPGILLLIRYPLAAIMLWMLLFPYFLSPVVNEVSTMHWVLHRLLIPGTLGFLVLSHLSGVGKRRVFRLGFAELAMLTFLVLCLVSIFLWSQQPLRSAVNLYDRVFVPFCAYGLIRMVIPHKEDMQRFLWVALITFVIQVSISFLSRFTPQMLAEAYQFSAWSHGRTVGTLRSPGVYSSTLVFLSLLLYHYAMNCRKKWQRYSLVSLFALAIFAIFLTFSRSSWVGFGAVLTGLLFIYPKATWRLLLILIALAALLGANMFSNELATAYERLTSEIAIRSIGGRVIISNAMVQMIKERPFFGWGYNRYRYYINQYKVPVGEISVIGRWNVTSHNTYLTIMTETGILSLFIYFFPVAWWLLQSIRHRHSMTLIGFWGWHLIGVLWLVILHMFIENNFADIISNNPFGTTLWWMVLGFIASVTSSQLSANNHASTKFGV